MNTLIIYANYKEPSFNATVRDILGEVFYNNDHEVIIRDLYNIKFNPVLSKKDLESIEQERYPAAITEEQKYIKRADVIAFVYPIWWSGMPAMLKGYIERVFLEGFAFCTADGKASPLLTDKKVMLFNTTGSTEFFQTEQQREAFTEITEKCIFEFCGMEILNHTYFHAVADVDDKTRKQYLDEVRKIAEKI
ncbi:MAG: NAD(P)H-dependent oxidoreductase [Bacteroidota bacterium]|nr:NAD(P)H-dependent oxidoreductase [Bacteroidota bacterium]